MASPFVATPDFPDVPPFPGVPPLIRNPVANLSPPQIDSLSSDAVGVSDAQDAAPQWGIFDSAGNPVLVGDTSFEVQFAKEYKAANYPIEQGGFASYNKVQNPFVGSFTFLKGGSVSDKADFLSLCDGTAKSLDLFVAVTPEVRYDNVNVIRYTYDRRAAKGVGLMYVDVFFIEIRVAPTPKFTKTAVADPSAADPTNTGTVSPQTPTPAQEKVIDNSFASQTITDGG